MKRLMFSLFCVIFLNLSLTLGLYASSNLCFLSAKPNPVTLKIGLVSDIHYMSSSLVAQDDTVSQYELLTGRRVRDLHEVLDTVFNNLLTQHIDILLISGDLTNHGELQSHIDFKKKLLSLSDTGIRIFVIPGNHDIEIPNARQYTGEEPVAVRSVSRDDFAEIYSPFGYGDALRRDEASLSYLGALNDSTWLLCLDTNRYDEHISSSVSGGRIREETMRWALRILEEAGNKGITVLGMMHHGLVEHLPYQSVFFPEYLVENWEERADMLADAGLKVMFTGHFHANDVTSRTSASGNIIYDVETASLAHYPFAYRIMELYERELSIKTHFVSQVHSNINLKEEYRDKMFETAKNVASMRFERMGVSIPTETRAAMVDMIAQLSVIHARGDEIEDDDFVNMIRSFAKLLDGEVDFSSFSLDFPPEDNNLTINLGQKSFIELD